MATISRQIRPPVSDNKQAGFFPLQTWNQSPQASWVKDHKVVFRDVLHSPLLSPRHLQMNLGITSLLFMNFAENNRPPPCAHSHLFLAPLRISGPFLPNSFPIILARILVFPRRMSVGVEKAKTILNRLTFELLVLLSPSIVHIAEPHASPIRIVPSLILANPLYLWILGHAVGHSLGWAGFPFYKKPSNASNSIFL